MGLTLKEIWRNVRTIGMYFVKWLGISAIIGLLVGTLSAGFLISLAWVTKQQNQFYWLLFLLPVGGAMVSFLYQKFGKNALRGNNLIIAQANGAEEDENIPLRLVPLTLGGTLVTHLFGGSAGREGTAVQMGGAVAEFVGKKLHLKKMDRRIILMCGIAAGFSSVFGTPLAGTVFALEVLAVGWIRHEALMPSFFSAFFANIVTLSFGVTHTHFGMGAIPQLEVGLVLKLIGAGVAFGIMGFLFSRAVSFVKAQYTKWLPNPVYRSFIGGCVIIVLVFVLGSRAYLGLSLGLLEAAFSGTASIFAFFWKWLFTVLTLGAGFQGGEVTPLFEIGATLGSSLAPLLALPIPFLAALGFIGVFTGATNTPIACFIMGIELFGAEGAVYLFLICVVSYLCSGNSGIYVAQRIEIKKGILFEEKETFKS